MEDTAVTRTLLQWFFPNGRITSRIAFVWFFLVVLFAAFGFLQGDSISIRSGVQDAILTGGLGVGITTCVIGGLGAGAAYGAPGSAPAVASSASAQSRTLRVTM